MTFTKAQERFSAIAKTATTTSTPAQLVQIQRDLKALLRDINDDLDHLEECAPVQRAITELSPRLAGQVTQQVIAEITSRSKALEDATTLLSKTADTASADARVLTFEKPKLIAAGLTGCIQAVEELRKEIDGGAGPLTGERLAIVAGKADALFVQLTQLQGTIKSA